jgi:hypothetical protein
MLPTAIAIDKLNGLTEATPTVNIKAELRISADDINKMLSPTIIDVTSLPDPKENKGQ